MGTQAQFWFDVLKLFLPIAAALAAIWIKEWYVAKRERTGLMNLLFADLANQLEITPDVVRTHATIPGRLKEDGFCIFFAQMSEWYSPSVSRLSQLDPKNAFVYLNFSAKCKSVEASVESLQKLLSDALGADASKREVLTKAVEKNTRGLNRTYLAYAESCHEVLKAISSTMKNLPTEPIARGVERLSHARELVSSH